MPRLYLIDASGFIFRAYYALPSLTRSDGTPTGAVYGFCSMMWKLREQIFQDKEALGWACACDVMRHNFRHDIDPNYKANRKEIPPDLAPQFALINEAIQAFRCPILQKEGFEADDVIASFCQLNAQNGIETVIVSSDKDLMQLMNSKVKLYDPMKEKWIQVNDVEAKFGVPPDRVIDVQALSGDTSDGIKGVPGIGPKTAAQLVRKFGSFDQLFAHVQSISQAKRKEALINYEKEARIAKQLVTLRQDVDLDYDLSSLKKSLKADCKDSLLSFFQKQEFKGLQKKISTWSQAVQATSIKSYPIIQIQKEADWKNIATSLTGEIAVCAIYDKNEVLQSLTFKDFSQSAYTLSEDNLSFFASLISNHKIIGWNLKPLFHFYKEAFPDIDDLQLMAYLLYGPPADMDSVSHQAGIHMNFDDETQKIFTYVSLKNFLIDELKRKGLWDLYRHVDLPALYAAYDMETNGMFVHTDQLQAFDKELQQNIAQVEQMIFQITGTTFNLASPQQMSNVLFQQLNLPAGKKTKEGHYKTDSTTLENLEKIGDYPIVSLILKWRALFKLKSTYTQPLLDSVSDTTHRIHTTFLLTQTNTGRLASCHPNLQNIPIHTPEGAKIRESFSGEKDNMLASFDYSQIELRLLAFIGQIKSLQQAFDEDKDIHRVMASHIFHCSLDEVSPELRKRAKAVNFGIIYGQGGYGLSQQLHISVSEANEIIQKYFRVYPEIEQYIEDRKDYAQKHGFVKTLFGRPCYIKDINSSNAVVRQAAQRQAVNAVLQGSNADIIRKAMALIRLKCSKFNIKMILQIHDELIFEGPQSSLEQATSFITHTMTHSVFADLSLTPLPALKVNFAIAKSWRDVHE